MLRGFKAGSVRNNGITIDYVFVRAILFLFSFAVYSIRFDEMIPFAQDELGILSMVSIFTGILDTIFTAVVNYFYSIYNMGISSQLRATIHWLDVNLDLLYFCL